MAGGLLAFVSYVFYYSLASVGGVDNAKAVIMGTVGQQNGDGDGKDLASSAGFAEFMKEAKEGMAEEEVRLAKAQKDKREADKLIDLDKTGDGVGGEEEREMARVAGFEESDGSSDGSKVRRPLWRRVVFFWRRD